MKEESVGNRKVVLTKWMLVIFTAITLVYLIVMGVHGQTPHESFYTWFVFGLGGIGGSFSFSNALEHYAKMRGVKDGSAEVLK